MVKISNKIKVSVLILSIIIALMMYPQTFKFLYNFIQDTYLAIRIKTFALDKVPLQNINNKSKIVFIFNDGWESVYTGAYPILREYKFKASVAVIPSLTDEKDYMSYKQLSDLYIDGWDMLNQSFSHAENMYDKCDELLADFNRARQWLKSKCFDRGKDFAIIPFGEINPYLINQLQKSGYINIRTSDNIIMFSTYKSHYYRSIVSIVLTTHVTVDEVENLIKSTFNEPKTIVFNLHKIGNIDDKTDMYYSSDKLKQICDFIKSNNEKLVVVPYTSLFES